MKHDLRRDFRYPIELDVELFSVGHRIGRFKTRDIGPGGLFIETGPRNLFLGHPVEVAFSLSTPPVRVPGVVVRRTTAGIGIRFSVISRAMFDALDDLLSIDDFQRSAPATAESSQTR